jgi:hypothetical protein
VWSSLKKIDWTIEGANLPIGESFLENGVGRHSCYKIIISIKVLYSEKYYNSTEKQHSLVWNSQHFPQIFQVVYYLKHLIPIRRAWNYFQPTRSFINFLG